MLSGCLGDPLEGTKWEFMRIRSQTIFPVIIDDPTIAFSQNEVSGDDGCNEYWANYEIGKGDTIRFDSLTHTVVACAIIEKNPTTGEERTIVEEGEFLDLLTQVESYEIKNDLLWLYFGEDPIDVMIFERVASSN